MPHDRPLTYSAMTTTVMAPTTAARTLPAHTRADDGLPDCSRIAAPSAASHSAVHGVMGGQAGWTRVSSSRPVAQPTKATSATSRTTATTMRPARISDAFETWCDSAPSLSPAAFAQAGTPSSCRGP